MWGARTARFDQFLKNSSSWLQVMFEPQHRQRNLTRCRSGDANHPNATPPGRRRNGYDCIVDVHPAILTGSARHNFLNL